MNLAMDVRNTSAGIRLIFQIVHQQTIVSGEHADSDEKTVSVFSIKSSTNGPLNEIMSLYI
jgi:hypothetical protein